MCACVCENVIGDGVKVVDSQKRAVVNDSRRDHEQLKPPSVDVAGQVAVQRQDVAVQVLRQPDTQSDKVHANFKQVTTAPVLLADYITTGNGQKNGDTAAYNLWDNCCYSIVNFNFTLTVIRCCS